jgi:hypothetical protein
MALHRAKVTVSVRKSIVALKEYANELSQENTILLKEYADLQSRLDEIRKREEIQGPLAEQMAKPITELNTRATLNLMEIRELKHQNRVLQKEIVEFEEQLNVPLLSIAEAEGKADYLLVVLQDYEALMSDMTIPPPLPYPHVCRDEMAWMIANSEKPDLPPEYTRSCQQLAEFPDEFNELPFEGKRQVMGLLKELRSHCLEIIREIKRIDLDVEEKGRHDCQIRKCLKQYAAVSLSMQKIHFK